MILRQVLFGFPFEKSSFSFINIITESLLFIKVIKICCIQRATGFIGQPVAKNPDVLLSKLLFLTSYLILIKTFVIIRVPVKAF